MDKKVLLLILLGVILYYLWSEETKGEKVSLGRPPEKKLLEKPKETTMVTKPLAMTITVQSEPKQLPNGKPKIGEFRIRATAGNAGAVYLADSAAGTATSLRYAIPAGGEETIKVTKLDDLWYHGTTNDTFSIFTELAIEE